MTLIPRPEWDAIWKEFDTKGKQQSLQAFSCWCNARKAELHEQHPGVNWSNGRYAVHVEDWLSRGNQATPELLAALTKDDIRYDWPEFAHLAPLLGYNLLGLGK